MICLSLSGDVNRHCGVCSNRGMVLIVGDGLLARPADGQQASIHIGMAVDAGSGEMG
jgi:hypothetical protein